MNPLALVGLIVGIAISLVVASTAAVFVTAAIGEIKTGHRLNQSKGKKQC